MGDKYKQMSVLTFSYTIEEAKDTVYFAHFAPYTYSDMEDHLALLQSKESTNSIMRVDSLCRSLGGNSVYLVTITENIES